jgi:hypothetical protein
VASSKGSKPRICRRNPLISKALILPPLRFPALESGIGK